MTLSTTSLFAGLPAPPAIAWPAPPELVDADLLVWAETVRDGACTSVVVASGTTVRLVDLDGNACAHLLVFNDDEPAERLDVENTLRAPQSPALTAGCRLLSSGGRTLATITHRSPAGTTPPSALPTLRCSPARSRGTSSPPTGHPGASRSSRPCRWPTTAPRSSGVRSGPGRA